jgi:sulfatase modifying factor 1
MRPYLLLVSLLTPCILYAAVTPPEVPKISRELKFEEVEQLPQLNQSPQLQQELSRLQSGTTAERIERLKRKSVADLVWFEGGTFTMGDWARWVGKLDSRPAHEVELTGFSMSRYKVTQAEYEIFKLSKGIKPNEEPTGPLDGPAELTWHEGKAYCQWLGQLTGLPYDLPTEAQWEYAARSRGQKFAFSTDDGNLDKGRNLPGSPTHARKLSYRNIDPDRIPFSHITNTYPVGLFPPSPMGLYDMGLNGMEWVNDWYDEFYYEKTPRKEPKGPPQGDLKVSRGWESEAPGRWAVTLTRWKDKPDLLRPSFLEKKLEVDRNGTTIRCVVNLNKPLATKN